MSTIIIKTVTKQKGKSISYPPNPSTPPSSQQLENAVATINNTDGTNTVISTNSDDVVLKIPTTPYQLHDSSGRIFRHRKSGQIRLSQFTLSTYSYDIKTLLCGRQCSPIHVINKTTTLLIPSHECYMKGCTNLLPHFPLEEGQSSSMLLVLQSVLKASLDNAPMAFQKASKLLMFESPSFPRGIFMNEILHDIVSPCEHIYQQYLQQKSGNYSIRFSDLLFLQTILFLQKRLMFKYIKVMCWSDSSDDRINLSKAATLVCSAEHPIHFVSVRDYIQSSNVDQEIKQKLMVQMEALLNSPSAKTIDYANPIGHIKNQFLPYIGIAELQAGVNSGKYFKGMLSTSRHSHSEGEVKVAAGNRNGDSANHSVTSASLLVTGTIDMNRAVDGDEVVVEIHSEDRWTTPKSNVVLRGDLASSSTTTNGRKNTGIEDHLSASSETKLIEEEEDERDDEEDAEKELSSVDVRILQRTRIPTARVVGILKKSFAQIVAAVPAKPSYLNDRPSLRKDGATLSHSLSSPSVEKEEAVLVIPQDKKYPRIRIRTRQWSHLQNQLVLVVIDDWSRHSDFPDGHIVRIFGDSMDWKTQIEMLLIKHSISQRSFSVSALGCLPLFPHMEQRSAKSILNDDILEELEEEGRVGESIQKAIPSKTDKKSGRNGKPWISSGWSIPAHMMASRRDLRASRRIFSVDPPGCQDIDDTMHVHWLEDTPGVVELGVSIADVCAFLKQGSALDLEAQARGTTIYMTHTRLDMLPTLLSSDIASLHGEMDRLAVSVVWHISLHHKHDHSAVLPHEDVLALYDQGNLTVSLPGEEFDVFRSAIHSVAAMTYEQAHNLIHDIAPNGLPGSAADREVVPPGQAGQKIPERLWKNLRKDLKLLTVIGRVLYDRRKEMGALDLSGNTGSELKFSLDNEGNPLEVHRKEDLEVHNTIEELMIYANEAVARLICKASPTEAMVRVHADPSLEKMQERMHELMADIGLPLFQSLDSNGLTNDLRNYRNNINEAFSASGSAKSEEILGLATSMIIRTMSEALYVCSGTVTGILHNRDSSTSGTSSGSHAANNLMGHFGLGLTYYTHFTSPIRRYADVVVHRQLLALIEIPGWRHFLTGDRRVDKSNFPSTRIGDIQLPESRVVSIVDDRHRLLNNHNQNLFDSESLGAAESHGVTSQSGRKEIVKTYNIGYSREEESQPTDVADEINDMDDLLDSLLDTTLSDKNPAAIGCYDSIEEQNRKVDTQFEGSVAANRIEEVDLDNLLDDLPEPPSLPVNSISDCNDNLLDSLLEYIASTSVTTNISTPAVVALRPESDELLDSLLGGISADTSLGQLQLQARTQTSTSNYSNPTFRKIGFDIRAPIVKDAQLSERYSHLESNLNPACSDIAAESDTNEVASGLRKPYSSAKVQQIASHLNIMNRRSKHLQSECQELFLRFYFLNRAETYDAIVYSLRANGFLVYIPTFDFRGPLFLARQDTQVIIDPTLLKLPKEYGLSLAQSSSLSNSSTNSKHRQQQQQPPLLCHFIDSVRVLPDYICQLRLAADDVYESSSKGKIVAKDGKQASVLYISRRTDALSSNAQPQIHVNVEVAPQLKFHAMQRIRVEISCIPNDNSLPQLRLSLVKIL